MQQITLMVRDTNENTLACILHSCTVGYHVIINSHGMNTVGDKSTTVDRGIGTKLRQLRLVLFAEGKKGAIFCKIFNV